MSEPLTQEECGVCAREKAVRHDDRARCARGLGPGLIENALVCYRLGYERAAEENALLQEALRDVDELLAANRVGEAQARIDAALAGKPAE